MTWDKMPSDATINMTAEAIKQRGIAVILANSGKEAFEKLAGMIPKGAEVANGSSTTLREIGYIDYLKSGKHGWKNYQETILKEKDPAKQADLRRMAVCAEYFIGSVNAISENGELIACNASGSAVSAYPFAAKHLILVAGCQKIVPDLNTAMERVRTYVYPLEDKRYLQAAGAHSTIGKWVIIEREIFAGRTSLILVKEKLGF